MEVDHDHKVIPIDFEATGSKVKATGALTKKSFSAPLLWSTVFIFGIVVVYDW
jgi:hypothetical protein